MRIIKFSVFIAMVFVGVRANALDVYVLGTSNPDADEALSVAITSGGHTATTGSTWDQFDGSQSLDAYDVVVFAPSYNWNAPDMPPAGQQAIVDFVDAGGGLVTGEWLYYNLANGDIQAIQHIAPAIYAGYAYSPTLTYERATPNATLDDSVPASLSFATDDVAGTHSRLTPKQGAVGFYRHTATGDYGLIGWNRGAMGGRVASFSTVIGLVELSDANYAALFVNAVEWAASGAEPLVPSPDGGIWGGSFDSNFFARYDSAGNMLMTQPGTLTGVHMIASDPTNGGAWIMMYPDVDAGREMVRVDATGQVIANVTGLGFFRTTVAKDGSLWVYDNETREPVRLDQFGNELARVDGYGVSNSAFVTDLITGDTWASVSQGEIMYHARLAPDGTILAISQPLDGPTWDIALAPDGGAWVSDGGLPVRRLNRDAIIVETFDHLNGSVGLAVDADGNVWAAEYCDNEVNKYDPDGNVLATFSDATYLCTGQLGSIAVDQYDNGVWLSDANGERIKLDTYGNKVARFAFDDPLGQSPAGPFDTDRDGYQDALDNCRDVYNPGQRDTDGDGIGNVCDADLNDDCTINFGDLAMMKAAFLGNDPHADLNGDGLVNFADLVILKAGFLSAPGPADNLNACNTTPYASGTFQVNGTWTFDLDIGAMSPGPTTALLPPHDFHFGRQSATEAYFRPLNGAAIAVFGMDEPTVADCATADVSTADLDLATVELNEWMCALTDDGRIARLRVVDSHTLPLNTSGLFQIQFTTWQID